MLGKNFCLFSIIFSYIISFRDHTPIPRSKFSDNKVDTFNPPRRNEVVSTYGRNESERATRRQRKFRETTDEDGESQPNKIEETRATNLTKIVIRRPVLDDRNFSEGGSLLAGFSSRPIAF